MSDAEAILEHCRELGLRLWIEGSQIAIRPAGQAPAGLLEEIRRHKPQVLDLLEAGPAKLTPDCVPWLHIGRQVLAGEFDKGERSMLDSLRTGLRSIPHPTCVSAKARLDSLLGSRKGAGK